MKKILYAASTYSHLERFHMPYIRALGEEYEVKTAARGDEADFPLPFRKKLCSFGNLRLIGKIRRLLKKEKFDAVILHTALAAFLVRAAMIGMRHRPRCVCVVHGYLFDEGGSMRGRILRGCEKLVRKKTDALFVMNKTDARLAKKYRLSRTPAILIDGMGYGQKPLPPVEKADARAALGIPENAYVFLFVGEYSKRKNQALLLRALAGCETNAVLLAVGDGDERESLASLAEDLGISDRVKFAGNTDDRELLSRYYAAADHYVSASKCEGLPFNIMEAMDAGLPIIASACKGQTDLLADTGAVLVPVDDVSALTDAMREAMRNAPARREYPTREKYTLGAVFERNLSLFRAALGEETE